MKLNERKLCLYPSIIAIVIATFAVVPSLVVTSVLFHAEIQSYDDLQQTQAAMDLESTKYEIVTFMKGMTASCKEAALTYGEDLSSSVIVVSDSQAILYAQSVTHLSSEYTYIVYPYKGENWGYSGWHTPPGSTVPDYWYFTYANGTCNCYPGSDPDSLNLDEVIITFDVGSTADNLLGPLTSSTGEEWTPIYPYQIVYADGTTQWEIFATYGYASPQRTRIWSKDIDLKIYFTEVLRRHADDTMLLYCVDRSSEYLMSVSENSTVVIDASGAMQNVRNASNVLVRESYLELLRGGKEVDIAGKAYRLLHANISSLADDVGKGVEWTVVLLEEKRTPYKRWRIAVGLISGCIVILVAGMVMAVAHFVWKAPEIVYVSLKNPTTPDKETEVANQA